MYNYIKALHIISVISWMAGLLYLPRLFVYHSENMNILEISTLFKVMEIRLYKYIMYPAAILTWFSGLYLAIISHFYAENWFNLKFILVLSMSFFHIYLYKHTISFRNNSNIHSSRFFRLINEFPTVVMILIVIIVVIKPNFSF
jgi:protoporphyrinogen IX oxidase